jgi:large subunit ribosomal protein L31
MVWVATETNRKGKIMKEGIHPNYREVCFLDLSNNFKFVTRSCVNTKEMVKMEDGRDLPLYKLDTSSESHPFYTGTQKSVDNMGGRVERFRNRFGKTAAKETSAEPVPEAAAAAAE